MNALDLAIFGAVLAAGFAGWRLGFIARALAWAGVAAGVLVGATFVSSVVTAFGGTSADDRVTVGVLFLLLAATLGQALGLAVSVLVHHFRGPGRPLSHRDRVTGAVVGVVGVLLLVWMTVPSLTTTKGWTRAWPAVRALWG